MLYYVKRVSTPRETDPAGPDGGHEPVLAAHQILAFPAARTRHARCVSRAGRRGDTRRRAWLKVALLGPVFQQPHSFFRRRRLVRALDLLARQFRLRPESAEGVARGRPTPGVADEDVFGRHWLSTAFHNYSNVSSTEASRLAALLVGQMLPAFSLLAPCDPGASTPEYVAVIVKRSTKTGVRFWPPGLGPDRRLGIMAPSPGRHAPESRHPPRPLRRRLRFALSQAVASAG